MNEVAKTETNLLPATPANPYAAYGAAVASDTPSFLKFVKGEFKYGADDETLPIGTRLIPNMAELKAGYIKWKDGEPIDEQMRCIVEGPPPSRDDCGDTDRNDWDVDPNGVVIDPWQLTNMLPFKSPETGEEFVFTTGSKGGVGAVGKLSMSFGRQHDKREGQLPIVELGASSYRHKTYGEVHVPVLRIVDWLSEADLVAGKTESAIEDDLADEIPF